MWYRKSRNAKLNPILLCLFTGSKHHYAHPQFVVITVLITEHQEILDSFLRFALSRSFQREASCVHLGLEFCPLTFMEIELFIQTRVPAPGLPAIPGKNFFPVLSLKKKKKKQCGWKTGPSLCSCDMTSSSADQVWAQRCRCCSVWIAPASH